MWNKITNRILFAYSIPIVFLLILGVVIYLTTIRTFKLQEETKQIENQIQNANELSNGITQMIASIRGYLIFPGDQYYVGVYNSGRELAAQKAKALATITDPQKQGLVNQLTQLGEDYHQISQNVFRLVDAKNLDAAKVEVSKPRLAKLAEAKNPLVNALRRELEQSNAEIDSSQEFLLGLLIIGTGLTLLATVIVGLWISLPLKQQLPKVVNAAEEIAGGNLTHNVEVIDDQTEVGQLLVAFQNMTKSLNALISQTQKSGIQITTSTTQIAAAGRQLQATVSEQAASTNQVSATSNEIAATSGQLVKTMDDIAETAQATALAASNSQADLAQMAQAMRQLAIATTTISSSLGVMNEKANNINSVVTTITKVADQTNLLSLNAAIEAEKAGEYGAGFAVVAREIRRLADQTAVATLEIEQMVKEMQSSVATGVMEMDKFNHQVNHHVELVSQISGQIAGVIEQVHSLTPRIEQVSQSMDQQFEGAQQISGAIAQLNEASGQTVQSLQETNRALEQLDDAAQGLQSVVCQFKVQS